MDRVLERAFNKVQGDVSKVQALPLPEVDKVPEDVSGAPGAIKRILAAWKNKEFFKLLYLPDPIADELGKPTWPCTSLDVSRAYRKLSVLVHPDKNPGDDARAAFEALNETHRMLKDAGRLEEVLREVAGRARQERDRLDALAAGRQGHAHVAAVKNAATKRLRQQQGAAFEGEILQQVKRRQDEANRKAAAVARARATTLQEEEEEERAWAAAAGNNTAAGTGAGAAGSGRMGSGSGAAAAKGQAGAGAASHGGGGGGDRVEHSEESDRDEEEVRRAALAAAARKKRKPTILN